VKDVDSVPCVIVGNKCDLEQDRVVTKETGTKFAMDVGCLFLETSALTNTNVKEIFEGLVRECYKSRGLKNKDEDDKNGHKKQKIKCNLL